MRWYHRRYQNEDGTLTLSGKKRYYKTYKDRDVLINKHVIPTGTTVYRTVAKSDEKLAGPKYITYINTDRDLYRGNYSYQISANAGKGYDGEVYEKTFKTTSPIVVPSRNELKKAYSEVLSNKKLLKETLKNYSNMVFDSFNDFDYEYEWENADGSLKTETQYKKDKALAKKYNSKNFVDTFIKEHGNESSSEAFIPAVMSLGINSPLKDEVIKNLKAKGYNAMVDEGGVGGKTVEDRKFIREGIDPIIVFDGDKTMKEVSTTRLDSNTRISSEQRYNKWRNKANYDAFYEKKW